MKTDIRYRAVLGKHQDLSIAELGVLGATDVQTHGDICTFATIYPDYISRLGGIVKYGQIYSYDELIIHLDTTKPAIIGVDDEDLGKTFKKSGLIKRFKNIDHDHVDLEVKTKGLDIVSISRDIYGIATGYQNIDLYAHIDFQKPSHGMQVGMMPSKLTHIMTNIGISKYIEIHNTNIADIIDMQDRLTVWDPFCGFGTTGFIVNHLGYNTICTDINPKLIKPNIRRRQASDYHTDALISTRGQDITQSIGNKLVLRSNIIVTEGRLGPVVSYKSHPNQLKLNHKDISRVYIGFLTNICKTLSNICICMSYPVYIHNVDDVVGSDIDRFCAKNNLHISKTGLYRRPGQIVARQIVTIYR